MGGARIRSAPASGPAQVSLVAKLRESCGAHDRPRASQSRAPIDNIPLGVRVTNVRTNFRAELQ